MGYKCVFEVCGTHESMMVGVVRLWKTGGIVGGRDVDEQGGSCVGVVLSL